MLLRFDRVFRYVVFRFKFEIHGSGDNAEIIGSRPLLHERNTLNICALRVIRTYVTRVSIFRNKYPYMEFSLYFSYLKLE